MMRHSNKFNAPALHSHRVIVESLLRQDTPVSFVADGPSMHPTLRGGDVVRVTPLSDVRLRRGHIVLFLQSNRVMLHRYIRPMRGGDVCFMAGDATIRGGEQVARAQMVGIARTRERQGRRKRLDGAWSRRWGLFLYYIRPMRHAMHAMSRGSRRPRGI